MNRNSLLEMSGRLMHHAVRFTLNKHNDNPMMQEMFFDGMNSEGRNRVERVQNYGFSSAPLPRDEQGAGTQSGTSGGVGGDGEQQSKGPAAEGLCLFMGGQRNHPVCIGIDDRRHRPMGLKPGENAQYDDIGQMTLLRRAFTAILSLDSKDSTGKMVERFVSLRHVQKQPQKRMAVGKPSQQIGPMTQEQFRARQREAEQLAAEQAAENDKYKHEGDAVNTEVRCTANRIEFRTGDKLVGTYDKGANRWELYESGGQFRIIIDGTKVVGQFGDNSKSFRVDNDHTHIRFGDNAMWVNRDGCFSSTAIVVAPDNCN